MASGLVAKKIALFEVKPSQTLEQQCRLKRKHAIRRKKYRGKERRIVTREGMSMIALSNSDEHLNQNKDSDEDGSSSSSSSKGNFPYCGHFSASCSALFDLISVDSSDSGGTIMDDRTHMEIVPRSKKLILKSKSSGETKSKDNKVLKRLNIIDIDIEIKIEQKETESEKSPSSVEILTTDQEEEYEPLFGTSEKTSGSPSVISFKADRIRLKASTSLDDLQTEKSVNYYCTKCSHETAAPPTLHEPIKTDTHDLKDNGERIIITGDLEDNSDNSPATSEEDQEPLYQNVFTHIPPPPLSLGAPPLPPKRLFGDSLTTNYSCLPVYSRHRTEKRRGESNTVSETSSENKEITLQLTEQFNEESIKKASSDDTSRHDVKNTIATTPVSSTNNRDSAVTESDPTSQLSQTSEEAAKGREKAASLLEKLCRNGSLEGDGKTKESEENDGDGDDDDDDEPYYEDLYDYCNGSESGTNNNNDPMKISNPILDLFRDQFNSLEQNVEDEVEYCDCSTIMALMSHRDTARNNELQNENNNAASETAVAEDTSSLRSYEIYDDCFGIGVEIPSSTNQEVCTISKNTRNDHDGIGSPTISGTTVPRSSQNIGEYIKGKVKASTPLGSGAWRKVSSSLMVPSEETTTTSTPSNLNLLSILPSLYKSKLGEPKKALKERHLNCEAVARNEVSSSSSTLPKVIAENERNVRKTKSSTYYSYGFSYGISNNNGNGDKATNQPRFGGRPVVAHPGQQNFEGGEEEACDHTQEPQEEAERRSCTYAEARRRKNNEGFNDEFQGGDHAHKGDKKDDNEIFNKPLPLPPTSASQYESVYEEPLYGITNQLTATYSDNGKPPLSSAGGSPGKRRSSAPAAPLPFLSNNKLANGSKPGSNYSHSPSVSSGSTYGYSSGSVNEYGESRYGPSSCQTTASSNNNVQATNPSVTSAEAMSIYGMSDKLPPTPPSKFSSIAKTAGRKIAKKFLGYRKTSKCGLEDLSLSPFNSSSGADSAIGSGASSPLHHQLNSQDAQSSRVSTSPNPTSVTPTNSGKVNCNGVQIKRPISRPSIPPPAPPPKNEGGDSTPSPPELPPSLHSQKSHHPYSIYDGKNEDDYEDSDFYDSDSELIRNFVSQVQPIYSMEEEPLYQYYTYGISLKPDDDYQPVIPKNLGLTLDMLVPRVGQRTLWCELPGVVSSGILSILSDKQKQLQEAIFEILTSEVSYLKSLDVLITLFYKNEELVGVLTEEERGYLFGNIEDVRDCSQAFLSELLGKWEESWYIQEIGEIISRNTETRFSVYKEYCRNKPYQDKTMQRLRHTRDEFVTVVKAIEEDEKCQMLQVDSFLMLPMQRITRLPLLVNAVIQRTPVGKEKTKCEEALKCLTNLVLSCNDAARESQDAEETMAILEKLEFTRGIKSLPDLGQFIMKGDFMKNPFDQGRGNQLNWTFRKAKRTFYWLLLFSKQLLVARRKANGRFEIIDMIEPMESSIKALPNLEGVSKDYKHFFMLHFTRKETVYFLAARTNSEVERWKSKLEAMKPKEELRVEAIFPYDARRPDEMSFYVGDIIRVSQIQPDGWYFGTKLGTGESGWFPGNYCCENAS